MSRVVIAGASIAGVTTAQQLREFGFDGDIVLLSAEAHEPYDRPPLTKSLLQADAEEPVSLALAEDDWYLEAKIDLRLSNAVIALDPAARNVTTVHGETIGYDALVIATGCAPRSLVVPGLGRLPTVGTLEEAHRLRSHLHAGRHLVVVGGGFIALEVAAVASSRGIPVTVLAPDRGRVLRSLDRATASYVIAAHESRGVRFGWGRSLTSGQWQADDTARLTLDNGEVIPDAVPLAAIGSQPTIDWLTDLQASHRYGVRCDSWSHTAVRDIYAVGDISHPYVHRLGRHVLNRHWTNAINQARVVAQTIAGIPTPGLDALPYYWSDQAELNIRYIGDLDTTQVLFDDVSDHGRVAVYGDARTVTGVAAINRPADFIRYQRHIGQPW